MMPSDDRTVLILKPSDTGEARQGMPQFFGISGKSAKATGISMNLTAFGPGGSAKSHYHKDFETAIYGVSGRIALFYGEALDQAFVLERFAVEQRDPAGDRLVGAQRPAGAG